MTTPFPFVSGATLTAQNLNDIQNLPISDKTASYVLIAGDESKRTIMNSASATTITVNNSIFTVGDVIQLANKGAGTCTVTAGAGVTITSPSALTLLTGASGELVCLSASTFLFNSSDRTSSSGVVQVKNAFTAASFSTTSTSFVDITGMSIAITPTSATNKVFVTGSINLGTSASEHIVCQLMRDATAVGNGTIGSSYNGITVNGFQAATGMFTLPFMFLDSPATTSATTYKLRMLTSAGTSYMNRRASDSAFGGSSTITVMEVTP